MVANQLKSLCTCKMYMYMHVVVAYSCPMYSENYVCSPTCVLIMWFHCKCFLRSAVHYVIPYMYDLSCSFFEIYSCVVRLDLKWNRINRNLRVYPIAYSIYDWRFLVVS